MPRPADPNLRERLLRASAKEFARKGYDIAQIKDITDRAGTSKASFYLHFESKADAVRELSDEFFAGMNDLVHDDDSFMAVDLPIEAVAVVFDQLLAKNVRLHRYLWSNRTVARLVLDGGHSAEFAHLATKFLEHGCGRLERFLAWGVRQGFFAEDVDVAFASRLIAGAFDRLARELIAHRSAPDFERLLSESQTILFGGILTPFARAVLDARRGERASECNR